VGVTGPPEVLPQRVLTVSRLIDQQRQEAYATISTAGSKISRMPAVSRDSALIGG
jgi:hypothetical protein